MELGCNDSTFKVSLFIHSFIRLSKAWYKTKIKIHSIVTLIHIDTFCIFKTFFTIYFISLAKKSPSLNELLSSQQNNIFSLLSATIDEEDVDRLLGVFDFENCSELAKDYDQKQFDMEELD